jgi:SAM-dependent methyltransferase
MVTGKKDRDQLVGRRSIALAKNGAHDQVQEINLALESGEIDEAGWHRAIADFIVPAYLAGDNPRSQSGHSGDEKHWERARSHIVDGIDRDGTFLDIGCASGHLMESVRKWARERGFDIEPYGIDIAPELANLARSRLPHWADRIFVGNAHDWDPPSQFDFVRTGLEYVPEFRQREFFAHLLVKAVAPGGRLIVGSTSEEVDAIREGRTLEEMVEGWGYGIAGRSERAHYHDERLRYCVFWVEKG